MRTKLRRFFTRYFNSWWRPATTAGGLLAVFVLFAYWLWVRPLSAPNIKLVFGLMALAGAAIASGTLLCSILWHLFKQAWGKLIASLLATLILGAEIYFVVGIVTVMMWMGPGADHFADNLTIPDGIEITEPLGRDVKLGSEKDDFQTALLAALQKPGDSNPTITADISNLISLHNTAPELLKQYLAASPAWHIAHSNDTLANRRWQIDSDWTDGGNGYYSNRDLTETSGLPAFNSKVSIGFFEKPAVTSEFTSFLTQGETAELKLSTSNDSGAQESYSHCVIQANGFFVEIQESAETQERRLTKATLAFLQNELAALMASPTEATLRSSLPSNSRPHSSPSITLKNLSQPGIYQATSWINPGEAGSVYLKAFEVTQETPLSAKSLRAKSAEQVGWSSNPDELFLSNTRFSIYEGDWGQPYAARFELWFSPDSGAGDRKLLEKNFKIEGWQH